MRNNCVKKHLNSFNDGKMEKNSKEVQTNQEMIGIGTQTCISHLVFSLITKNQSTQFLGIGESIFKTEEDTKTESEHSDHYLSCNESDTDFLQSHSSDSMEEEKEKNKINGSAFFVFWPSLVVLLSRCFTCFDKTKLITKI